MSKRLWNLYFYVLYFYKYKYFQFSSVQLLSHVQFFVTPWTTAREASLSITNSGSLLKFMPINWCHPTISSSVVPFSSHLQSFPASGSFQMSQFFASDGQSIGASASASALPIFRTDFIEVWLTWSPCSPWKSQESSPTPQFKSINSLALSFL